MNSFDYSIISFLNQFVGRHPAFDSAVVFLNNHNFLKGGLVAALCWWAWFKNGEGKDTSKPSREIIVSAMFGCFISIVIARLIVSAFPFRTRPIALPLTGLHFPASTVDWQNWSSFPSDHAIMFFTLTTCLFFVSPILGWIALLDSTILICLPRIYLGIHYPTDVLAGAAIGIAIGLLANQKAIKHFVAKGVLGWMEKYPGPFYALFFLFMYQVTVIFFDVRQAITNLEALLK